MKKTLLLVLVLISVLLLLMRFAGKTSQIFLGISPKGGLSIISLPDGASVLLDGIEVGKTPYEDKNLHIKDYTVRLQKDQNRWEGKVRLTSGTLTVVNRELAKDSSSSAGEVLTLQKGRGMTIISNPSDAEVEIDGKSYGKTPLTVNVDKGEHTIAISHANYLKRSIRVSLPEDYNLTVSVDLALSEADLTTVATAPITATPQLVVKDTPTGFLRVRDKSSLNGKEISQVKPGDILILLEELSGWDRVRLSDGQEGYVSSSYVEKKAQ